MSILTDDEIADAYTTAMAQALRPQDATAVTKVARAIEASVIAKLATVNVEPVAWHDEEFDMAYTASELAGEPSDPTMFPPLFTTSAIAAARVQALEEAAKVAEGYPKYGDATAAEIRALIT